MLHKDGKVTSAAAMAFKFALAGCQVGFCAVRVDLFTFGADCQSAQNLSCSTWSHPVVEIFSFLVTTKVKIRQRMIRIRNQDDICHHPVQGRTFKYAYWKKTFSRECWLPCCISLFWINFQTLHLFSAKLSHMVQLDIAHRQQLERGKSNVKICHSQIFPSNTVKYGKYTKMKL